MRTALIVGLATLAPWTAPAHAQNIVCLKDGRFFEAESMERKDGGVQIHYKNGEVFVPGELILDAVLAADATAPPPSSEDDQAKLAKGLVRYEGKWIPIKRRDEMIQKRVAAQRKELEEMRARSEWRNRAKDETQSFLFEYTVPDHVFEGLRDTMQIYFSEFAKAWKIKPPGKQDRLRVCFYANEDAFHQTSGAGEYVGGYFRFVRPMELNIYYDRLDPVQTEDTMFHEANHYLQKLIDPDFLHPHFPGESLAEYYGASSWDPEKKKLTFGLVQEGRLVEIQRDIASGKTMSLAELVETDRMYEHYTWGWSLVYFLMKDPRYAPKFQGFMVALAKDKDVDRYLYGVDGLWSVRGKEVWRVFMRSLGLKDADTVRKLENEWHEYVKTKLKVESVDGLAKAGTNAMRSGRPVRAMRLFQEAADGGSKNPIVFYSLARMHADKGKFDAAIENVKKALEIDPLNGQFYAMLGALRVAQGGDENEKEGHRFTALGKELGYESPIKIKLASESKDSGDDDDD